MDPVAGLLQGFAVALTPVNLLWSLVGVTLGTAVGVLPGIGPALTVALLLPATYGLEPVSALIMFAGIYYGGMYGGSTAAILLNTPGESASIVTSIEGNAMARAGRGAPALATAALGSFVAGSFATVGLTLLAVPMVALGRQFGAAEYFALMVLAFTTVSALLGSSVLLGLASLFIGLGLGCIGTDQLTGQSRLTFGVPELLDGIEVVVMAVGLFAVGEAFYGAARHIHEREEVLPASGSLRMSREDLRRSWPAWLRGTALGFPFGALPAGGAEIPTFLSYLLEKRLSRHPQDFGKGVIEGVAGPEAANNAAAAGVLVPLLSLGLPTSATAAVMLAAFQQYNLRPGPLLFDTQPALVWGLIASLYVGNVMLLVLNLPLVGLWVRLLTVPKPYLYAGILVFSTVGAYSLNGSVVDIAMLFVLGLLGFAMRVYGMPVGPAVIGLILGPLAETQLRRALSIAQGDWTVFVTRPLAASLLAVAAAVVLVPLLVRALRARRA